MGKYEQMHAAGATPEEIYCAAKADGLDGPARIRLLRQLFQISLAEAKEVTVIADGLAASLTEYQESLIPALEKAFEAEARD